MDKMSALFVHRCMQEKSMGVALFRSSFAWMCVDADIDYCVESRVGVLFSATVARAFGLYLICGVRVFVRWNCLSLTQNQLLNLSHSCAEGSF